MKDEKEKGSRKVNRRRPRDSKDEKENGSVKVKKGRPRDSPPAVSEPIPGPEEVHHATLSKLIQLQIIMKLEV